MATRVPDLAAIPIPHDVVPGPGWCAMMREMADHIGAYATLSIIDIYGGKDVYIPADATKNPFLPLIGAERARTLSWVYRRETLALPTAGYALARARRAGILAAVRCGETTVTEAARILGIRRDYASRLITKTDEGKDTPPAPLNAKRHDPRQGDLFAAD